MNPRKSAQQWQQLIQLWQDSDLTVKQFCKENNVAPSNFYAQRKRLQNDNHELPDFSALENHDWQLITPPDINPEPTRQVATDTKNSTKDWDIELTLPGGVIFRMRN